MTIPFLLAVSSPAGCVAIDTETVLARDIATIVPAFSSVPGDFLLGFVAPLPACRACFKGAELERLAKNRGVELTGLPDLCVARRTFIPQPEQIRAAMLLGLGIPGAKIEILSAAERAVPSGELVFPRSGLQAGGLEG